VRLWDVAAGREVRALERPATDAQAGGWISCGAYSADGKLLAEVDRGGTLTVWDAASGQQRHRVFNGHAGPAWSVAFAPDGKTLITGGTDSTAALWDAASGKEVRRLRGHVAPVEG